PAQSGVIYRHKILQAAPSKGFTRGSAFLCPQGGGFSAALGCLHIVSHIRRGSLIYLAKESSDLYFELSRLYFHAEKLSWTHYLDRMIALKTMCEPDDPIYKRANRILLAEEWNNEERWCEESGEHGDASSSQDDVDSKDEIQPGLSRDRKGNPPTKPAHF
ncbi:MAG: hypothetical protein NT086_03250, partial [Proteobacteria bacterium]|nr:hypothetical protein [Pseudomonadota bacterium]